MNYTDMAIDGQQLAELKKPMKRTGWRLKVKKPESSVLADPEVSVLLQIDQGGANSEYDLDTEQGAYKKILHDEKTNRTFLLHNAFVNTVEPLVSIINHDLESTDPGFIETVSTSRIHETDDWEYNSTVWTCDMAYNYDSQLLAVAPTACAERFTTGLYVLDCNKYIDEIVDVGCGQLKDNPNYLTFDHWVAGDEPDKFVGGHNSQKQFVAYYNGRFYVWVQTLSHFGTYFPYYQLGYYKDRRTYKMLYQYGHAPYDGEFTGYESNIIDDSITFPTYQARDCSVSASTYISGTSSLFRGDLFSSFTNVTSFNISRDGMLSLGCTPNVEYQYDFGAEACVALFDLSLEGAEPERQTWTHSRDAYYDSYQHLWIVDGGTFTHTFSVSAKGMVRVTFEKVAGSALNISSWEPHVQNSYGTMKPAGATVIGGAPGMDVKWAGDIFCYHEDLKVGIKHTQLSSSNFFEYDFEIAVEQTPVMLVDMIGPSTTGAEIVQDDDTQRPETGVWEDYYGEPWEMAKRVEVNPNKYTVTNDAIYDSGVEKYFTAFQSQSKEGLGLWVVDCSGESKVLRKYTTSNSGLKYSRVTQVMDINDTYIGVLSDDYKEEGNPSGAANVAIQFFNKKTEQFHETLFDASPLAYQNTLFAKQLIYNAETGLVGMAAGGNVNGQPSEAWIWVREDGEKGSGGLRKWWDGGNPDFILGEDGPADAMGQVSGLFGPAWSQSKGQSSNAFTFNVQGMEYLPWAQSELNESKSMPGFFSGLLQDGARLIVERGVWDGRQWSWIQEGQQFIMTLEVDSAGGDVEMAVQTQGVISMIVNRSTYSGTHRPEELSFDDVILTSDDGGLSYYYENGGTVYGDWAPRPAPAIKINGEFAPDYKLVLGSGLVIFDEPQTGVTATFTTYVPGTNEAEDIVRCILSYPEELGGCGLDESWYTRKIDVETLSTSDSLTYYFSKNNIVADDFQNGIYVDETPAAGYTWDFSAGSVTFSSPQTGVVTGDCKYFTIQKSGVTLEPMHFTPANGNNSYKCIEEVLRRVAPNYIMREGRDGKLEVDFFTQKPVGEEDIVIEDDDIILTSLNSGTSYEQIATRVLSIGSADIEDLPNLCLGRTVTDLWPYGWHAGIDVQWITDGDPATGTTAGWGGKDGYKPILDELIKPENAGGIPCVSIDLGAEKQVGTIIIARPSQRSNEGEGSPDHVQKMSVDVSRDGADWTKIIDEFNIPPGGNEKFTEGVNFLEGTVFRYIRVNIHMIGLYVWEHTDSQMGISEVQCYPPDKIIGEARLQSEDPDAPLYDRWCLLDKYGVITHIARNGSADSALYTQEKADLDARYSLEEIVRLMDKVTAVSPWLPGIPVFSTVKITNKAMGITRSFFVESRSAGEDGDTYDGVTLP